MGRFWAQPFANPTWWPRVDPFVLSSVTPNGDPRAVMSQSCHLPLTAVVTTGEGSHGSEDPEPFVSLRDHHLSVQLPACLPEPSGFFKP